MAGSIRHTRAVHPAVESKRDDIAALCVALGIRRLDVFGSAVDGRFDPQSSDVDVLVEFDTGAPGALRAYWQLKEGLEQILGRPVDVVVTGGLRNPYVRREVLATRELLHAA